MKANEFRRQLLFHMGQLEQQVATDEGDWIVKGFIDVYQNIYTISVDTKVISKIIELMLFPLIAQFAKEHDYRLVLSEHQNHYPDVSFILPDDSKIALDFKSTYRTSETRVSGFTLGSFTGYFRDRKSTKNITFPYEEYIAHFVLGTIYSRSETDIDERQIFKLADLHNITSVVNDFLFLLQEKWHIANDKPGSGNTKNIGSVHNLQQLITGAGPFSEYGPDIFNDYWMNYLTPDMARAIDSVVPYRNLSEYWLWRKR